MPIFDQGYQHWNGALAGHGTRWLAVTRQGVRAQLRNRWTKYLVISSWTPALALAALLAIWGLFEQRSRLIEPLLFLFDNLPEDIRNGPQAYRASVWTMGFHAFFLIEVFISMILVMLVGPDLISQDLRFNAVPLYFSRPLRRIDYFLGKLGVIATFLLGVTVVPAVLAYLIGISFSLEWAVVRDTWGLFVGAVGFGLIVAFCSGLIMLAFSSLARNSRHVALIWLGFWLISWALGGALAETVHRRQPEKPWQAVSYPANLYRIQEEMLGTAAAQDQFARTIAGVANVASRPPAGVAGLLGRILGRPQAPPAVNEREVQRAKQSPLLGWLTSPFPWTTSAAVLAGLCGVSIWILSTRVKSLDRAR